MYESNGCNAECVEELVNLKKNLVLFFVSYNIHEDYLILYYLWLSLYYKNWKNYVCNLHILPNLL